MNDYKVRQAWCLLQVKLCDPCLSALKWFVYHARRYTSARLLPFFISLRLLDKFFSVKIVKSYSDQLKLVTGCCVVIHGVRNFHWRH